jgi:DNA polymerase-4
MAPLAAVAPSGGAVRPLTGEDACTVLHIDMDAFYVAVELRERPELADVPLVVGGDGRGVVLSASYAARRYGVRSGIPTSRARRLVPDLVVIPAHYERYAEVSAGVMQIFRSITAQVEPVSLDEAFVDVSGSRRRLGSPRQIAELIRARVADEQGITCTVGGAATTSLAKIASGQGKPDGLLLVPPERVVGFLHPLPVGALWGVGEQTETRLRHLGLSTVGDLARVPRSTLVRAFGPAQAQLLTDLSWGRATHIVAAHVEPAERSVGAQRTFSHDIDDVERMRRELLSIAVGVASRLRAADQQGRTVVLTVRFADFTTLTRSRTLRDHTDIAPEIYAAACATLDALALQRVRVRLLGIRVTGLVPTERSTRQLVLGERDRGWSEAERAVDRAVHRFGPGVVRPATLIPDQEQRLLDRAAMRGAS